jgi:hypothetical protein
MDDKSLPSATQEDLKHTTIYIGCWEEREFGVMCVPLSANKHFQVSRMLCGVIC